MPVTLNDVLYAAGKAYSPLVATAAFAFSAFTYFRDNRRLQISFELNFYVKQTAMRGRDDELVVSHGDTVIEAVIDSSVPHILQRNPKGLLGVKNGTITLKIFCTNSGRRPMSIKRWSLLYNERKPKKEWRLNNGEIRNLNPNPSIAESTTYTIEVDDLLEIGLERFAYQGAHLVVEDNHGKLWRLPDSDFLSLQKGLHMYEFSMKMNLAMDEHELPEKDEHSPDYQAGFESGMAREKLPPLATRMWQRGFHDAFQKQGLQTFKKR
jgi:hypothetical protein